MTPQKNISTKNYDLLQFLAASGTPRAKWTAALVRAGGTNRATAGRWLAGYDTRTSAARALLNEHAGTLPTSPAEEALHHLIPDPAEPPHTITLTTDEGSVTVPLTWPAALALTEILSTAGESAKLDGLH